jgi:hypothetical protein
MDNAHRRKSVHASSFESVRLGFLFIVLTEYIQRVCNYRFKKSTFKVASSDLIIPISLRLFVT